MFLHLGADAAISSERFMRTRGYAIQCASPLNSPLSRHAVRGRILARLAGLTREDIELLMNPYLFNALLRKAFDNVVSGFMDMFFYDLNTSQDILFLHFFH